MENSNANKTLAKNTVIYMIGNMGSKILQMLILPIITAVLSTEQYGYYDLVITTISLITPIITLQMIEGMFRYLFDGTEKEKKETVSTVIGVLLIGLAVLSVAIIGFFFTSFHIEYPFLILLNYISYIVFSFTQKYARCEKKNSAVAISGVLNTIIMLIVQAVCLLIFNMRTDGMLIANCISYFGAALYLELNLHIEKRISWKSFNIKHAKELLKYSAPLVPNSICWWFVSACDKYVISFFLSTAATGIYSIAGRFSQLLTMFTSVFQMAWQESSITESTSKERNKFYSDTFNTYMRLLLGGYIFVLPLIRIIMPILVANEFQKGYLYNPLLLIGGVFSAFSQFYGSAYLAFKKTKGVLSTTIVSAIVNLSIAVILIKPLGLFAPALGTTCAFLVQWIMRIHQMKEYFCVTINKRAFFSLIIFTIIVTVAYYFKSTIIQVITLLFGFIIFVVYNRKIINTSVQKLLHRKG